MKTLVLSLGLLVMVVVVGCGGGGQGIAPAAPLSQGRVSPAALDSHLVGAWSLVRTTKDGVEIACRIDEDWPTGTVREVGQFRSTGTVTVSFLNASGAVIGAMTGTWSTIGGNVTFTWPSKSPETFPYSVTGNVFTISDSWGGHTYVKQWAKQPLLTAHDANLVRTWRATGVWLNGVSKPLAYLTGSTSYPGFARTFMAGGTSRRYCLSGGSYQVVKLPKAGLQNWASGGGLVNYLTGKYQAAIYTIASGTLTIWQLDAGGNTLKMTFKHYGAAGAHDARMVGTWHPVSGKIDGVSQPLAKVFGWGTGVTSMKVIFAADGTCEQSQYAGTVLYYDELDTWYTANGIIYFHFPGGPQPVTYVVGTGLVTCSWTSDKHKKVVVFKAG